MTNANWLLAIWGTITILIVGQMIYPYIIPEAEGINEIKGYVTEAKKKAQAEAEAETKTQEDKSTKTEKLYTPLQPSSSKFSKIIGITLSKTCYQMHKYNLTTNCPTYKDLLQFDNTIPEVSGVFKTSDGVYQRQPSNYKKHCNYYHPQIMPLLIVVDPDGCWFQHRGIKTITIQAIKPENMLYKLTADSATQDILRDLQNDEKEYLNDKNENDNKVDSLENSIDNKERQIIRIEDQIDELKTDDPPLKKRNLNFQLKAARDNLVKLNKDLIEEEVELASVTSKLANIRSELQSIKTTSGSGLVVNGTTHLGIGRSVKECKFATVGADLQLITDTLNYLISKCKDTTFDSRKTSYIEQTPINIMDHKYYQFMKWQKDAIERCKVKC